MVTRQKGFAETPGPTPWLIRCPAREVLRCRLLPLDERAPCETEGVFCADRSSRCTRHAIGAAGSLGDGGLFLCPRGEGGATAAERAVLVLTPPVCDPKQTGPPRQLAGDNGEAEGALVPRKFSHDRRNQAVSLLVEGLAWAVQPGCTVAL